MKNEMNDKLNLNFVRSLMSCLNIIDFCKINPEWICVPTYLIRRRSSFSENELTTECGKGITDTMAKKSALFEAIERYSAEMVKKENLIKGKFIDLKNKCNLMPPIIISNEKLKESTENLELEWCEGYDLLHDRKIFVPADYVFFPYKSAFYLPNTTGLASGETYEDAILHGLYEVTEHDTLNIYTYNSVPGKDVVIDRYDGYIYDICNTLTAAGITLSIKFLPNDTHVPVILVLFEHITKLPGTMTAGLGCHLDPYVATLKALTECAQTTSFWYYKMQHAQEVKNERSEHPPLYMNSLYRKTKTSKITLRNVNSTSKSSTNQNIKEILRRMRKFVSHAISVDLTTSNLGVPAVRIIVPEFENTLTDDVPRGRTKAVQKALRSHFKSNFLPSKDSEINNKYDNKI